MNWGSFGGHLESFGGHLRPFGDHLGTKMGPKWKARESKGGPGTGPAPGSPKVPKVCNSRLKQPVGISGGSRRYQSLGPPGDSLKYHTRTL